MQCPEAYERKKKWNMKRKKMRDCLSQEAVQFYARYGTNQPIHDNIFNQ